MTRRPVLGPKPLTEPREPGGARHAAPREVRPQARGSAGSRPGRGNCDGRDEAEERVAGERASLREQALTGRLDFQLNEYAEFEATIRTGFAEIERHAVARILKPFLTDEIVKYAVDQLMENIARLWAGGAPGLITIRGPERILEPACATGSPICRSRLTLPRTAASRRPSRATRPGS